MAPRKPIARIEKDVRIGDKVNLYLEKGNITCYVARRDSKGLVLSAFDPRGTYGILSNGKVPNTIGRIRLEDLLFVPSRSTNAFSIIEYKVVNRASKQSD